MPSRGKKTIAQLREQQTKATTEYIDNITALKPLQDDMERMKVELDRLKAELDRKQQQYESTKEKAHKIAAKISEFTHINHYIVEAIESQEKADAIKMAAKTAKSQTALAKKNMKKGVYSEPILAKVNALPEVIVNIVGSYLTYETLNELLSENLMHRVVKIGDKNMLLQFIKEVTSKPKYLTLLPREEARKKVVRLSNGDFNPQYSWFSYCLRSCKQLKTEIYDTIMLAKARNPQFAHSVLKTVAVLNTKKWRYNKYVPRIRELTEDDLPPEYL